MFKAVDKTAFNFRCPYCGDSKKSQYRARGYLFLRKNTYFFKCHNCQTGRAFFNFLKDLDPTLYQQYNVEKFKEQGLQTSYPDQINDDNVGIAPKVAKIAPNDVLKSLKCIGNFDENFTVYQYLINRNIPKKKFNDLYYSVRFMEWINTILPEKFNETQLKVDEPRLVIPFYDANKNLFAVTGRSFKKNPAIKYMTIKFDDVDKIYGMDTIDLTKKVYIVEGPIDSWFLENSIAFSGSSGKLPDFKDSVIILDNEPRNREIIKTMEKFIDQGHQICIWPDNLKLKDINDMVISGLSSQQIKTIIDENTYSGIAAKLRLADWNSIH